MTLVSRETDNRAKNKDKHSESIQATVTTKAESQTSKNPTSTLERRAA